MQKIAQRNLNSQSIFLFGRLPRFKIDLVAARSISTPLHFYGKVQNGLRNHQTHPLAPGSWIYQMCVASHPTCVSPLLHKHQPYYQPRRCPSVLFENLTYSCQFHDVKIYSSACKVQDYRDDVGFLVYRLFILTALPYFQNKKGAGHPRTMATTARIVSPFPYPSLLYMDGAKRGNPNPARERRHETAASPRVHQHRPSHSSINSPDAAYSVNVSTTYVCIAWKFNIIPAPTNAMPMSVTTQ